MDMKKGITPVVAIVLLLLLTIAAAGAAFAFSQNLLEQQTEQGRQQVASSLTIRDIECDSTAVNVSASNDGDIDLENANAFAYWVANGSLAGTDTQSTPTWTAGSFSNEGFNSGDFGDGSIFSDGGTTPYRIEIEFDNGYSTSGRCEG